MLTPDDDLYNITFVSFFEIIMEMFFAKIIIGYIESNIIYSNIIGG
jgi:hypothetical protein